MDDKDDAQELLHNAGFKLGIYRHYKGGEYLAYSTSIHEETLEPLVHYYSLLKKKNWTRTLDNFTGHVENLKVKRFVFQSKPSFRQLLQFLAHSICHGAS